MGAQIWPARGGDGQEDGGGNSGGPPIMTIRNKVRCGRCYVPQDITGKVPSRTKAACVAVNQGKIGQQVGAERKNIMDLPRPAAIYERDKAEKGVPFS